MQSFPPNASMSLHKLHNLLKAQRLPQLVATLCHPDLHPGKVGMQGFYQSRHEAMHRLLQSWSQVLETAAGSSHNHQTWPGGLKDHLAMMMRHALPLYFTWQSEWREAGRYPPFCPSQVALVILLHDAEKFVRYAPTGNALAAPYRALFETPPVANGTEENEVTWEDVKWRLIEDWGQTYGFTLSDDERSAIRYAHGEGGDYSGKHRVMNELAAFLHALDITSARIGYLAGKGLG